MADATVEKIKALGLRHGELGAGRPDGGVCLVFAWQASRVRRSTVTPDEIEQVAKRAASNINAEQNPKEIAAKLVEDGMTNPSFVAIVDRQVQSPLRASTYKVANPWITREPGAGLIREQPVLVAPANLYAYPGRGGAQVYVLDEQGKRTPEDPETAEVAEVSRGKRFRRAGGQGCRQLVAMSGWARAWLGWAGGT